MTPQLQIEDVFRELFAKQPAIFVAPGRINLIGEHTDYNEGFVMPAAIDRHIVFAAAANQTDRFNCHALDLGTSVSFSLDELKPGKDWINYLMGVVHGFHQVGFKLGGIDCVFKSSIPLGAGLSSSAALCCGFSFAISDLLQLDASRLGLVKIAQHAEHHFAGVKCGIMDQYASLFGEAGCALLLDCKSLTHEILPADFGDYTLVLVDTRVRHALAATAYNDRRATCEEGVRQIRKKFHAVDSLRDVTAVMLLELQDRLGEDVFVKCRYVVEEMSRTQEAARLLKAGDVAAFGALLYQTHWGLSKAYDVSCEELDFLVSLTEEIPGLTAGARLMGGGFGGCTINLVRKDKVDYFRGFVYDKYFATFEEEPEFYLVSLSQGVHRTQDL